MYKIQRLKFKVIQTDKNNMKIKNNIFYLCIYAFSYAFAENSTEAGALCIDESLCISHNPSLSRFVESIPQCPKFILRQQILRDQKSSLTTDSPDEICSTGTTNNLNHFENAHKLESYLQNNPHFSNLNTPPHFSSCLSQGVLVPLNLGKTSFHIQEKFLPEHKKKLAVAEYYSSLRRLSDGVERSLQNITAIDLMIGQNALLKDISCNNFELLSQDVTNQCRAVKQCPANNSSPLQESAKDTLLALQAVETIEKERLRLVAERGKLGGSINQNRYQRRANPNKQKIEELTGQIRDLEERQQNIQSFYPWILGKQFKKDYNAKDYTNYAQSSEERQREMEIQIAGLIQNQLTHTRAKLKERTEDFLKASACIKGEESLCEDLDVEKVLAKAPPIDHNEIFERDRKKELKSKMEEGVLSPEERQEYRRLVTREGTADGLFQVVSCLQTQRKAVRDVHKELALGALDVGIVVGTMGLGTPIVAGRIALRLGSALSKAQKLSKARRIQNLGIFGTDVSLSTPYMKEAMNICEDELNQLEETTAGGGNNNKVCEKVPVRAKHTSDLKSCILQASLASLPITLPILGLSGMAVAKRLKGTQTSSSAEKAEEVLGLRLSPEQRRAVETAHLVGQGERGKNGALAGIGNYTEAQLRRKAEILRQAGFSKEQRRTLMEEGVVGVPDKNIETGIPDHKIKIKFGLSSKQLRKMKQRVLGDFTRKPVGEMNVNNIRLDLYKKRMAWDNTYYHIPIPSLDTLTRTQTQLLDIKLIIENEYLSLSKLNVEDLSRHQVRDLNIEDLSQDQLQRLDVKKLSQKQVRDLNIEDLSQSQVRELDIESLSLDQVQELDIESLSLDQIRELNIENLSQNQLQKLDLGDLTHEQLEKLKASGELNKNQKQQLEVRERQKQLDVANLTSKERQELDVRGLLREQTQQLNVLTLTNDQIQQLNVRHLTRKQLQEIDIEDLTFGQINQLNIGDLADWQVWKLKIENLHTRQLPQLEIRHLTNKQKHKLDVENLTRKQIQQLEIRHLTNKQKQRLDMRDLTLGQVQSLNIADLLKNQIQQLRIEDLTVGQTQRLHPHILTLKQTQKLDIDILTRKQTQLLNLTQLTRVQTQQLVLKNLLDQQWPQLKIEDLTREQTQQLVLNRLSANQMNNLNVEDLTRKQTQKLNIEDLNNDQIENVNAEDLTRSQRVQYERRVDAL